MVRTQLHHKTLSPQQMLSDVLQMLPKVTDSMLLHSLAVTEMELNSEERR